MKAHISRHTYLALFAAFLLRALIPLGYMPAALGDGLPFILCPDNLPVAVAAVLESGRHVHDHDAHGTPVVDQCVFGDLMPDLGVPVTVDPPAVVVALAPPAVRPFLSFAGRVTIRPTARGPPA